VRIVFASIFTLLLATWPGVPALASQIAVASGSARIVVPAGITVTNQVVGQSLSTISIIGSRGDAVGLAVPASLSVSNAAGQTLALSTVQSQTLFTTGSVLSEDAMSVSVGTVFNGQVEVNAADDYRGVLVVLAQYN
jgi:hypothetical protein